MNEEGVKARVEYLEKQIRLCQDDLAVVEKYKEDPNGLYYDTSISLWAKLSMKLKKYQEELEILINP